MSPAEDGGDGIWWEVGEESDEEGVGEGEEFSPWFPGSYPDALDTDLALGVAQHLLDIPPCCIRT